MSAGILVNTSVFVAIELLGEMTTSDAMDIDGEYTDIPVYLNTSLFSLVQTPTRPEAFHAAYLPTAARVKHGQLCVDIALDSKKECYSAEIASKLGNSEQPDQSAGFGSVHAAHGLLKTLSLESTTVPDANATYMVGRIQDGSLYVSQLRDILQLRPALNYIDRIADADKLAARRGKQDARSDTEDEGKTYQLTTRGPDHNEVQKQSREALRKMMDMEPWTKLQVLGMDSVECMGRYSSLWQKTEASDEMDAWLGTERHEYLDQINPLLVKTENAPLKKPENQHWLVSQMQQLSLADMICELLKSAHTLSLETVLEITQSMQPIADIISQALQSSRLIRGLFVVRSDLLYTDRPCLARIYLLGLFVENTYISLEEFMGVAGIPLEMAVNMLGEIAIHTPGQGYRLKHPPCKRILEEFKNIVDEQTELVIDEARLSPYLT